MAFHSIERFLNPVEVSNKEAIVAAIWAVGLIKQSGKVLLDANMVAPIVSEIIEVIESSKVKATITDLHVWSVGKGKYS